LSVVADRDCRSAAAHRRDRPVTRVVLLSKALVVGTYQRKAELIAAEPDIELAVAVPPLWRDGDLVRRLERSHTTGYRLIETPIARPGDFHLHFYPRLGRVLDAERPDLAHIDEEPYNLATFLALAAARRRGMRTVFFTWQNLARRYPPPFRWFERYAYRRSDGAIAGSRTAEAVLRAKGYRGPVWVIPQFGVDPDQFRPPEDLSHPVSPDSRADPAPHSEPDARPSPSRPLRVGYAGRLVPAKGVDLLVGALAGLPPAAPWTLRIVGQGPEQPRLVDLVTAFGLTERVTFTPWLPSADLPAFYRGLDVLVLPSRSTRAWIEQFGRVLIEAMACGVVCVGADSGEIPHVIGDAGLVFPEGDAAALRAALARLAGDAGLRASLARSSRERVLECFTMARVAAETAAVYRALAAPA